MIVAAIAIAMLAAAKLLMLSVGVMLGSDVFLSGLVLFAGVVWGMLLSAMAGGAAMASMLRVAAMASGM
jgi:hypothetical protein